LTTVVWARDIIVPADAKTIADAMKIAEDGGKDRIIYKDTNPIKESIVIDKCISLIADPPNVIMQSTTTAIVVEDYVENFEINGFTIEAPLGHGINIKTAPLVKKTARLLNLKILGAHSVGINFEGYGAVDVLIENTQTLMCWDQGIWLNRVSGEVTIKNCESSRNALSGIAFTGDQIQTNSSAPSNRKILIVDSVFKENSDYGVYMWNANGFDTAMTRCTVEGNSGPGIFLNGEGWNIGHLRLEQCSSGNNYSDGISCGNYKDVAIEVEGGDFSRNGGCGIRMVHSQGHLSVTGNTISENKVAGIQLCETTNYSYLRKRVPKEVPGAVPKRFLSEMVLHRIRMSNNKQVALEINCAADWAVTSDSVEISGSSLALVLNPRDKAWFGTRFDNMIFQDAESRIQINVPYFWTHTDGQGVVNWLSGQVVGKLSTAEKKNLVRIAPRPETNIFEVPIPSFDAAVQTILGNEVANARRVAFDKAPWGEISNFFSTVARIDSSVMLAALGSKDAAVQMLNEIEQTTGTQSKEIRSALDPFLLKAKTYVTDSSTTPDKPSGEGVFSEMPLVGSDVAIRFRQIMRILTAASILDSFDKEKADDIRNRGTLIFLEDFLACLADKNLSIETLKTYCKNLYDLERDPYSEEKREDLISNYPSGQWMQPVEWFRGKAEPLVAQVSPPVRAAYFEYIIKFSERWDDYATETEYLKKAIADEKDLERSRKYLERIVTLYEKKWEMPEEAIQYRRQMATLFSGTENGWQARLDTAKALYAVKNYETAASELDDLLKVLPNNYQREPLWLMRGLCLMSLNRNEDARNHFAQVINSGKSEHQEQALYLMGYSYIIEQQYQQSQKPFSDLVKMYPNGQYAQKAQSFLKKVGEMDGGKSK
jgi:tetratricopeptide (TPR) repeat protein